MKFRPPERLEKWIAYDGALGADLLVAEAEAADNADGGMAGMEFAFAALEGEAPDDGTVDVTLDIDDGAISVSIKDDVAIDDSLLFDGHDDIWWGGYTDRDMLFPYLNGDNAHFSSDRDGDGPGDNDFPADDIYVEISAPDGGDFGFLEEAHVPENSSAANQWWGNFFDDFVDQYNIQNGQRIMLLDDHGVLREHVRDGDHFREVNHGARADVDMTADGGLGFHVTRNGSHQSDAVMDMVLRSITFTRDSNATEAVSGFEISVSYRSNWSNNNTDIDDIRDDIRDGENGIVTGSSTDDDGGEEPGDGGEEPGDGGEEPGDGGEEPGDGGEEPGDGGEEPGDGGEEPGDGGEDPGDGGEDPGDGGEEPGDGGEEPGDGGDAIPDNGVDEILPPVIPSTPGSGESGGEDGGGDDSGGDEGGEGSAEDGGDDAGGDDAGGEGDSGSGSGQGGDMGVVHREEEEDSAGEGVANGPGAEAREDGAPDAGAAGAGGERAAESAAGARHLELARDMEFMLTAVRNERAVLLGLIGRLQSEYLARDPAEFGELRGYLRRLFDMGGREQATVNRIIDAMNREMEVFRATDPAQRDGLLAESVRELIDSAERHSGEMGAYSQAIEAVADLLAERRGGGQPPPTESEAEALFAAKYEEALSGWLANAARIDPMGRELTAAQRVGGMAQE